MPEDTKQPLVNTVSTTSKLVTEQPNKAKHRLEDRELAVLIALILCCIAAVVSYFLVFKPLFDQFHVGVIWSALVTTLLFIGVFLQWLKNEKKRRDAGNQQARMQSSVQKSDIRAVREQVTASSSNGTQSIDMASDPVAAKIQDLKKLRDSGAITQEDFEMKKQELLTRL